MGRTTVSGYILQRKGIAVTVIFLFLSIAVVPSINSGVVKASADTDWVEVRTEACGTRGVGDATVRLTRIEYQSLEQYFIQFRERLNQTTTRAEAVPIFKDAILTLNTYGLVPKGMNVEQIQRLVMGYQDCETFSPIENDVLGRWTTRNHQNVNPNLKNVFCLLFATATKIPDYPSPPLIVPLGVLLVFGLLPSFIFSLIGAKELADKLAEAGLKLWMLNPFRIFNFVLFTGYEIALLSLGLKGLVSETIGDGGFFMGFSGLMLTLGDKSIFLGFAFSVSGPR